MIQVEDAFGEFHQIKRKTGAWVNWGMFHQVWDVFGDVAAAIDGSYSMIQVEDAFGEFHQIKRKTGAWVNWGMFHQVWVKVREVGKWQQGDYVVKADADAVFVPQRLREW